MSLRPRKPLVITFALGALALGVLMVYSFGGREIFTRHEQFLLYFDDSVNGLAPGSLVKFKGVPVGAVDSIRLSFRAAGADHRIPVLIRLNADLLQNQLGVLEDLSDPAVLANEVRRGLRGQLDVEHVTTGGMYVSLDYYPHAAAPLAESRNENFAIIPTVPSGWVDHIDKAGQFFAWLPTFDFETEVAKSGDQLDEFTTMVSVVPYAEYHQKAMDALHPLADFDFNHWQQNLSNILVRFDHGQTAIATASQEYTAASQDFVNMNTAIRQNLTQADDKLTAFRTQIQPAAPWLDNLTQNLKAMTTSMQNLTRKADNLEEQPDILPKVAQ